MNLDHSKITIRFAIEADVDKLFEWRNSPEVYKYFRNPKPVDYNEHVNWFKNSLSNDLVQIFLFEIDGEACGQVRFNRETDVAEISITVDPLFQGKGLGKFFLLEGEKEIIKKWSLKKILANVDDLNVGSKKVFVKAGYTLKEKEIFEKLI